MSRTQLQGFSKILWVGAAVATLVGAVAPAQAQEAGQTIPEAFEDAYFTRDRNFYENQQFPRSLSWYTGPFTENEIASDGRRVNRVYQNAMTMQNTSDITIRTPDLPNPFAYSLLSAPLYQAEALPIRPASNDFYRSSDPGMSYPVRSSGPVRGLW